MKILKTFSKNHQFYKRTKELKKSNFHFSSYKSFRKQSIKSEYFVLSKRSIKHFSTNQFLSKSQGIPKQKPEVSDKSLNKSDNISKKNQKSVDERSKVSDRQSYEKATDDNSNKKNYILDQSITILKLLGVFMVGAVFTELVRAITKKLKNSSDIKNEQNNQYITTTIDKFVKDCSSSDNIPTEKNKIFDYILEMQKIFLLLEQQKIQKYYNTSNLKTSELEKCIEFLHIYSSYSIYSRHDGRKGEQIAQLGKVLLEQYINDKLKLNLKKVSIDELLKITDHESEFSGIIKAYSKILYTLGRSLIYQNKYEAAEKHFEHSKKCADRYKLFEGVLSERSGLRLIEEDKFKILIKQQKYKKAKEIVIDSIQYYMKLKQDNAVYIKYKPGKLDEGQTTICLANDIYNRIECDEQLIKYYSKKALLNSIFGESAKTEVENILMVLIGNENEAGLLKEINRKNKDNKNHISNKKYASVVNTIANSLLELNDQKLNLDKIYIEIIKLPNLVNFNTKLEIIEGMFQLSLNKSPLMTFTLADAYDGIARVKATFLREKELNRDERSKLRNDILKYIEVRDEVVKKLKLSNDRYCDDIFQSITNKKPILSSPSEVFDEHLGNELIGANNSIDSSE